jgi:hypothetical protein
VVDEDGVHLKVDSEHVYPEWLLLETKRKYSRDKAAVAGKEILISVVAFSQVLTDNMVTGTGKNVNTLCALQTKMFDTSGVHIPHLASRLIDGATPKDQTPGPMSGTADADLDDDVFTGSYNYASATETQDRGGSVKVLIDGMVAGQTGTITVMGWKDATNGDRTGTLFINGVSAGILDGASNATSNQIADIAFTVTADGELEVRLDSIGFAYLNGMKISFAA